VPRRMPGGAVGARPAAGQALEIDPFDEPAALELGQPRQERMSSMQLIGPERQGDEDALRSKVADQEGDRLARGRVCPM
jgi:hypothetical protein